MAGFAGAYLLSWAALLTLNVLLKPWPECRQGRCRSFRDYVWMRGTVFGWEKGGRFRYRCKCGDEYLRDGRKFLRVLGDGTTRGYKRYECGVGWMDD